MTAWVMVPALDAFRIELNEVAPNRDKTSDGGIGNKMHQLSPSGHNPDDTPGSRSEDTDDDTSPEVRARDFDRDLNRPGLTMEMVIQYLVRECRARRVTWIKYIIFNRRIWTRSNGWVTQVYTGVNPHDKHAHISCRSDTTSENNTRRVGLATLVEDEVDLSDTVHLKTNGEVRYSSPTTTVEGVLISTNYYTLVIRNIVVGLRDIIAVQSETIRGMAAALADASGDVDVVSVLTGVDERLTALHQQIDASTRDAVADLGEGGASQVRA